ncbi:MAG TPA: hypothetical protein PKE07_09500 [Lacibacter sp.]|nr:hypothetical protein [Lacibacter sp.]HMO89432.1 hypothetical protein [Lacibacter sp.]
MQQFAAQNFLDGKGITLSVVTAADPSSVVQQPLKDWPPALTLFQALFLFLLRDWVLVSVLLTVAAVVSFFLLVRTTLRVLEVRAAWQALAWLLLMSNHLFFHEFGVSDWLGLSAIAAALLCCLYLLSHDRFPLTAAAGVTLLFILPACFRYQYYPVVMLFPAWLMMVTWRSKPLLRPATTLIFITTGFFLLLLAGGTALYGSQTQLLPARPVGFYPANLLRLDPFLLKTVIRLDYLLYKFPFFTEQLTATARALHMLLLGLLFFCGAAMVRRPHFFSESFHARSFILFSAVFIGVTLFFLAVLSLRYAPQEPPFTRFTYIGEARYSAATMYVLLLVLLLLAQQLERSAWVRFLVAGLLCFNLLLFARFLSNLRHLPAPLYQLDWAVQDRKAAHTAIENYVRKKDQPILLAWYPTSYIIMGHYSHETFLLRNSESLFSGVNYAAPPHYLVYAVEKDLLETSRTLWLRENNFHEVFNNGYYRIFVCDTAERK